MLRTHTCGELRKKDIKKTVKLCGWVHTYRDHGGVIFIDLRDRYGKTQIVFDPSHDKKSHKIADTIRREWVVQATGKVRFRGKDLINKKLKTGEIEVLADSITLLNKSTTPPFEIEDNPIQNEDLRLKYRYLDLRRKPMQNNMLVRHNVITSVRAYLNEQNFLEIETPILAKSTPEGARDYLVPSRVNLGKFYALPQSPQLYKQILMISGMDRYYQIARCLRDEDMRADRQPEFTQVDIEMSFIKEEDIYTLIEGMLKKIWKEILNVNIKTPFPRLTYQGAMDKYGCDRPDTRFGLNLIDMTDTVKDSGYKVFEDIIKKRGTIKCINVKKSAFSRKDIDSFIEFVKIYDAKGMSWMKMNSKFESSVTKYFKNSVLKKIEKKSDAKQGDLLLFVADHKHKIVNDALAALRLKIGKMMNLIDSSIYNFLWITDFPMVEYDENEERHIAVHHPFTSPKPEDMKYLDKNPDKVRARAYDVVLNGWELGGGSIRIHDPGIQRKVFKTIGLSSKEADERFGFLLDAFKYGTPPHGGIALGVDRIITLLTQSDSIRNVIAFPKTKNAEELMVGSPSEIDDEQLKELHLKLDFVKSKKDKSVFSDIEHLLENNSIEYEALSHEPVYTSEQAAKVRKTKLRQGAKALIYKIDNNYIMAVLSAEKKIDNKKLKTLLKTKKFELAQPKEVKKLTGLEIGAIPPFGSLFDIKTYVDVSLSKIQVIAFNAGSHTNSVKMKYSDYKKAVNPVLGDFSKKG